VANLLLDILLVANLLVDINGYYIGGYYINDIFSVDIGGY
jgi:hypothetical protein